MKFARIIALLLLVATCLTMVVACNNDSGTDNGGDKPAVTTKNPNSGATTTTPPGGTIVIEQQKYVPHNVGKANYDTDFNFLAWEQSIDEYDFPEGLPAEADDVQTELYNRNRKVEEHLGVTLRYNEIPGNAGAVDAFVDAAYASISVNTQAYDAVAAYTRCGGVLAQRGVYVDLYDVPNIDTDMPWWPIEITSVNTVADKLYFATGDIATSLIYQMLFLIINQEYAKDLGVNIDKLQQDALAGNGKAGGFTLDVLFDICEGAWADADTTPGKSDGDRFGLFLTWHNKFDIFYMGAGLSYVEQTEDGLVTSDDYYGTTSRDILARFAEKATTNDSYWIANGASDAFRLQDGKSLVYSVEGVYLATTLRDATFTYRILPGPKYNAEQIDYYTAVGFPHSLYSIPTDAKNREMSGAVLEVLAAESYNEVTPTLFGKVFLYKLTNNQLDTAVLNMIRDRVTFDLGRTFFEDLGGDKSAGSQVRLWRNCMYNKSDKIRGFYNTHKDRWNGVLSDIYEKLSSYGD